MQQQNEKTSFKKTTQSIVQFLIFVVFETVFEKKQIY